MLTFAQRDVSAAGARGGATLAGATRPICGWLTPALRLFAGG
jgi:hypothetical protein